MRGTNHLGSSGVNRRVNHERGSIKSTIRPAGDDATFVIDLYQIGGFHEFEGLAEWVDPEGVGVDRVAEGDVTCYACGFVPYSISMGIMSLGVFWGVY